MFHARRVALVGGIMAAAAVLMVCVDHTWHHDCGGVVLVCWLEAIMVAWAFSNCDSNVFFPRSDVVWVLG